MKLLSSNQGQPKTAASYKATYSIGGTYQELIRFPLKIGASNTELVNKTQKCTYIVFMYVYAYVFILPKTKIELYV